MHAKKESGEDLEITQTGEYSVCTEYYQPQGEDVNPNSEERGANIGSMSDQEAPRTLRRSGSMASIDPKELIGKPCRYDSIFAMFNIWADCRSCGWWTNRLSLGVLDLLTDDASLVLSMEFRELKLRELDPALGWKGILAQQQGEGEQFQDETLDLPPQIQAMSK
ncbi:hypothetical protein TIFTF001_006621 [Ficus carica]|uniref:Uncharacterized protein n=1 Tax=Ficus carica TaxID=3494 RepID=A0AA88CYW6_FICCA|nr:hypothetical protein TIFTF001_006621 [Ficus carica]